MKIALAQLNFHIGNFEGNFAKMSRAVAEAKAQGADMILFPELAVCGYPPRDFLEFNDFIRRCDAVVAQLAELSQGIAIVVGSPSVNPRVEGKDLYNSAFFLADGAILDVVHKALLPTYDVFDEYRYFEPNRDFHLVHWRGERLALTICEDLWNVGNENPLYPSCPMDELMAQEPTLILNLSASPFHYGQAGERLSVLRHNCERYGLPLVYVNHVGAQTELLFDGGSVALRADGTVYEELPYFEECLRVVDLAEMGANSPPPGPQPREKYDLIRRALVMGIRDYFGKLGFRDAILGLSGGVDSALTLVLAAEALGPEHVRAVLMPSPFSSDHSIADSLALCANLGVSHDILPISTLYETFLAELQPLFAGKPFDLTEENLQARLRAVCLMALSNKHGYILLNTSNKSEAAVGYGTLYGDMCGGLSVIGDVYKTEVYALCAEINREREVIPANILTKPPSAELRHNQKDSDSLPEYDQLDAVLLQYIEHRKGPREIIAMGFDEELVRRTLRLVNINEYKRHQTPPILRVSPKAFGMGRRMPIVGWYLH
ncbi:MAG: NAD+ synthase [Bacteroidetes bacterium]|nr:NAD+ synthase [Bacteroidota bacterium]